MSGTPRLRLSLGARALGLSLALLACGGAAAKDMEVGVTPRKSVGALGDWPPVANAASDVADAVTVDTALRSVEGAQVRVRGYLVARTPPCAACNVSGQSDKPQPPAPDRIGRTARPTAPDMPGCNQCPPAAVTFSDQRPTASPSPSLPPLRAVGVAEGLQARHLGHVFVLTGTFHPRGAQGPELDVTDVRAIPEP